MGTISPILCSSRPATPPNQFFPIRGRQLIRPLGLTYKRSELLTVSPRSEHYHGPVEMATTSTPALVPKVATPLLNSDDNMRSQLAPGIKSCKLNAREDGPSSTYYHSPFLLAVCYIARFTGPTWDIKLPVTEFTIAMGSQPASTKARMVFS